VTSVALVLVLVLALAPALVLALVLVLALALVLVLALAPWLPNDARGREGTGDSGSASTPERSTTARSRAVVSSSAREAGTGGTTMRAHWRVRRTPQPRGDGARRWDLAYHCLLHWARTPDEEADTSGQPHARDAQGWEEKEDAHGDRRVRTGLDQATTADANHALHHGISYFQGDVASRIM